MIAPSLAARLGAVCYVIWSLLHFQAAYMVYRLGETMTASHAQGRVMQDAWNLFCFAIAAFALAITLNWRSSRAGFWINLAVISVADLGFVIFLLLPGWSPLWPGVLGPVFWIAGGILTAASVFASPKALAA